MNARLYGMLIFAAACFALPQNADAERPNIVLILIDDLSHYGVTAYGADQIGERNDGFEVQKFSTPNIDRIAREGLRCDNAFAYPLCEPTRVALMSGQYNSRNYLNCKSQHSSEITFGDVFQREGYATGMYGKWKQTRGTRETPAKDYIFDFGWDDFCCFDVVDAGQRFINPNLVTNGVVENYQGRTDVDPATGRRWYGPDICNRKALEFIDHHKDEPFFLYYPMMLVHDEHKPTPDTQPHSLFDQCEESIKNDDRHFFPDMIAYTDKLIGNVVRQLEKHGLRENTVLVVMGDNGTKENFVHVLPDGSEYPGGKGDTKDNGLHVPLVISYPSVVPTGEDGQIRSYDGLVDLTDIYPTLCEAAGIETPNPNAIDGISFWPQALGANGEPRDVIYTWYNGNHHCADDSTRLRYAFDKHFKRYAPHTNFPEGRFFDLRNDLLEQSGDHKVKVRYWHFHHSGLDVNQLDAAQQAAYKKLGRVIKSHRHVPVTGLRIRSRDLSLLKEQAAELDVEISPNNATRQNVIWQSSDPAIASVDKFGTVTGHQPGQVKLSVYSWDDASPTSDNKNPTFSNAGISDSISVIVNDTKS